MSNEIKNILYTTDLSDSTRPVMRYAVALARAHDAKLHILHVVEPITDSGRFLIESYLSDETAKQAQQMAKALQEQSSRKVLDKIHARVNRFCSEELGVDAEQAELIGDMRVVSGTPAEAIVNEAERMDTDLIVVGTNAGTSFKGSLLGSTARKVSNLSKKPVLIIPMSESSSWGD